VSRWWRLVSRWCRRASRVTRRWRRWGRSRRHTSVRGAVGRTRVGSRVAVRRATGVSVLTPGMGFRHGSLVTQSRRAATRRGFPAEDWAT
jgi:hypothetical protein